MADFEKKPPSADVETPANENGYREAVNPLIETAMTLGALRKAALDRERLAAFDADDKRRRPAHLFKVGDRVVMTGMALNSMGVRRGHDVARVWTVRECFCDLCRTGRFVCTDQACIDSDGWRHIANAALRLEVQPSVDDIDVQSPKETERDTGCISRGLDIGRKSPIPPRREPSGITSAAADLSAYRSAWAVITGSKH